MFKTLLPFASLVVAAVVGCNEIDRTFDCNQICDRWRDCVDDNYNTAACADRCEDNAANQAAFDQKADDCENCLDDRTCGESIGCTADCVGIVP